MARRISFLQFTSALLGFWAIWTYLAETTFFVQNSRALIDEDSSNEPSSVARSLKEFEQRSSVSTLSHEGLKHNTKGQQVQDNTSYNTKEKEARQIQDDFCVNPGNNMGGTDIASVNALKRNVSIQVGKETFHYGMNVYDKGDVVSHMIAEFGDWESSVVKAIAEKMLEYCDRNKLSMSDVTFVDIGANIGMFTLAMAAIGAQVVAFEPLPSNQILLRKSLCLEENKDLASRVVLFPIGLGDKKETCLVYSSSNNRGNGNVKCYPGGIVNQTGDILPKFHSVRATIDVERLDEWISLDDRTVLAAKMDVEGYEAHVVQGGPNFFLSGKIPYIHSEFSPLAMEEKGSNTSAFLKTFVDAGYELHSGLKFTSAEIKDENWKPKGVQNLMMIHKDEETKE